MRTILCLLMLGLAPLLAGCETAQKYSLTYRVWNEAELNRFSDPAPEPHLALFEATNQSDVVVQYDALSEKHDKVRRRAYYLGANQERILQRKQPRWIKPPMPQALIPIPVSPKQATGPTAALEGKFWALMSQDNKSFVLYTPSGTKDSFDLPVFAESSGTPIRVILTPVAVAGDTVMLAGVAAVVAFFVWIEGGAPTH